MMGGLTNSQIWYAGLVNGCVAYKEKQRARKMYKLDTLLAKVPAIVLKGHYKGVRALSEPEVASLYPDRGFTSFMMDGKAKLASPDGLEGLLAFLKANTLVHTLKPDTRLYYIDVQPGDKSEERKLSLIINSVLAVLPPSITADEAFVPVAPVRKSLLRDSDIAALRKSGISNKPKVKLFGGPCTWLLCSMDEDNDTCWAYCDIGQGIVEFGTVSLAEIETSTYSPMKLRFERDKWFDGNKIDVSTLCDRETLAGI